MSKTMISAAVALQCLWASANVAAQTPRSFGYIRTGFLAPGCDSLKNVAGSSFDWGFSEGLELRFVGPEYEALNKRAAETNTAIKIPDDTPQAPPNPGEALARFTFGELIVVDPDTLRFALVGRVLHEHGFIVTWRRQQPRATAQAYVPWRLIGKALEGRRSAIQDAILCRSPSQRGL